MGQDTPSNTDLAHKTDASLKQFLGWMIPENKWIVKKYSTYILQYRSVIHRATHFLPIISSLIIIIVERDIANAAELTKVHKKWTKAEKEIVKVRNEIAELRREIKKLKSGK